ncbi:reverse transcriptase [Tanacetum coccineum]
MTLRGTPKAIIHWLEWKNQDKEFEGTTNAELLMFCVYPNTRVQLINVEGQAIKDMLDPKLTKVVDTFRDVFAVPIELPPQITYDHRIPLLPNTQPVNIRPYRNPPIQKDAIEVMVEELLDSGVIKPSNSPFASPIALMNEVFQPFLRKFTLVFFDDILIYSKSSKDHVKHLSVVLVTTRQNKLFAKKSTCVFGTSHVEYLGHVISAKGVATDPSKIKAMQEWPVPTNVKKLRGFLGLTGYYRWFIMIFSLVSRPLTQLLKKEGYKWTEEAQQAFETLKVAMMKAPVLALLDFSKPFEVETYASRVGIWAVL